MGRFDHDRGPARRGYNPRPDPEPFVPWKPEVCEFPGCTVRWPCLSHDGMAGPWRCREHHGQTGPKPPEDPFIPAPTKQGSLL